MRSALRVTMCASALALLGLFSVLPLRGAGPDEVVLFSDNFENPSSEVWRLDGADGKPGAQFWEIEQEPGGNRVLSGKEHTWGTLARPGSWADSTFKARVKLGAGTSQGLHLNYRLGSCTRYFVAFHAAEIYLAKTMPCGTHTRLVSVPARHEAERWYTVAVVGSGGRIRVYVDGQLRIDHSDPSPVVGGSIGLETLSGAHVHIDDVDVTGPSPIPTPSPPAGFAWTFSGGPRGGIGYDIRIHPLDRKIIFVTDANAGVHRSVDGGLTWEAANSGITARTGFSGDAVPIFSLTVDPNDPRYLWAGTQGIRGVFKSVDGGKTWAKMDKGIEDRSLMEIRSFTVEPGNSNIVYLGGNYRPNPRDLAERGFIYKTTDGGKQWVKLTDLGALVRWILVDPTNVNVVYASTGIFDRIATKPEGILKSEDAGRTWRNINEGLTSLSVGGLAMHPQDSQTLVATTGKASAFLNEDRELYGAVFKTTNGGANWRKVYQRGRNVLARYSAVVFAPGDPNIVYVDAGNEFLRSADGGETWTRFDVSPRAENRGQPIALAVDPTNPNIVLMNAYDGGVFRSEDGGSAWVDASAGYSGSQSWDLAIDPSNPGYVVVGSKNGVHVSYDGAQTWKGRNTEGAINNILSIAIDPRARERLLVGSEISGWIRLSIDGGISWRQVLAPLGVDTPTERISVYQIAIAPSRPTTVYAATGIASLTIGVAPEAAGRGIWKSLDGGSSWMAANRGLEAARLNVVALAVSPRDDKVVYAGTLDAGIFKSVDGGASWGASSNRLPKSAVRSLAISPDEPEVVYAGTDNAALWRSVDGGKTWQRSSAGMDAEASVRSIVVDPSDSRIVYAADRRTGVYRSVDAGGAWTRINQGLRMRAVNRLAVSANGTIMYAATEGGGVFRIGSAQVLPVPPDAAAPRENAAPATRVVREQSNASPTALSSAVDQRRAPTPIPSPGAGPPAPLATAPTSAVGTLYPVARGSPTADSGPAPERFTEDLPQADLTEPTLQSLPETSGATPWLATVGATALLGSIVLGVLRRLRSRGNS